MGDLYKIYTIKSSKFSIKFYYQWSLYQLRKLEYQIFVDSQLQLVSHVAGFQTLEESRKYNYKLGYVLNYMLN